MSVCACTKNCTHRGRPLEFSNAFASRRVVFLEVELLFDDVAVEVAIANAQCLVTLSRITGIQLK